MEATVLQVHEKNKISTHSAPATVFAKPARPVRSCTHQTQPEEPPVPSNHPLSPGTRGCRIPPALFQPPHVENPGLSLRGLLGCSRTVDVAGDIGGVVEGTRAALDALPDLSEGWGCGLGADEGVDAGFELLELVLDEGALGEAGAEEDGVDGEEDPGAGGEDDGGEEDAEPEDDLEEGDKAHGCVVVLLDEPPDVVGGGVGFGGGLAAGGRDLLRGLEGWEEVCAGVCRDVEDGVDAEGKHG